MQNRYQCGCEQGFVPADSNWDFNGCGDWDCSGCRGQRRRHRDGGRDCGQECTGRARSACQESRCGELRDAVTCREKTCQRERAKEACASATHPCTDGCGKEYHADGCNACTACTGRAECPCERCTHARSSDSGNCVQRAREKSRGSVKNRYAGMVKGFVQELDELFASESALRAGTLFPELHKPMNGYYPCDEQCGTCGQAAAFAAWELRLYLNTHPDDEKALALFRKLCMEAAETNYATTFLTDECYASGWNWVNDPWPWEYDCRCDG